MVHSLRERPHRIDRILYSILEAAGRKIPALIGGMWVPLSVNVWAHRPQRTAELLLGQARVGRLFHRIQFLLGLRYYCPQFTKLLKGKKC